MNSSLLGWVGPLCWVNWALVEWLAGQAIVFCTFLKEREAWGPAKTLDTLPSDPGSWEQHDPLCTKCSISVPGLQPA
jgi:hypothetical protein